MQLGKIGIQSLTSFWYLLAMNLLYPFGVGIQSLASIWYLLPMIFLQRALVFPIETASRIMRGEPPFFFFFFASRPPVPIPPLETG